MSDLQLGLLAAGGVFIALVLAYNIWQERRARRGAEKAFGPRAADALMQSAQERREPTIGMPPSDIVEAAEQEPRASPIVPPEELEAPGGPAAEVSSRIDTVAVILSDDPVMSEQLEPLLDALQSHTTPVHIEGIVDEQWHPVESSPRRSWRELRVGLQLASRSGPLAEDEIERFNAAIADFAAGVGAVSQREAPPAAAARARELDRFCAEADLEIAVNVVGQFGATFAAGRVKALALDNGLSETGSGELVRYDAEGMPAFAIRRFDDPAAKPSHAYFTGLTFALDLPQVRDPGEALDEMVRVASEFAHALGGQLVDDNRQPLSEAGLASIRRTLEHVVQEMQARGVPAGSPLARRLFS